MTECVALLRGIGPGNPKMRNVALRGVFERLGFDDVRSVISSGNILFSTDERPGPTLERRIEAALADHLGSECVSIVRSRRQIETLVSLDVFERFDDTETGRCNVTFLQRRPTGPPPPEVEAATILSVERGAVFFVVDMTDARAPRILAAIERAYGHRNTTRTWRTVHRIARAFAA